MRTNPSYGEYAPHPAADKFPLITGGEYNELVRDIHDHGLHRSIVLQAGTRIIVDGRNRYRACIDAGVAPTFREREFANEHEIWLYVYERNILLRHLSASQRAAIVNDPEMREHLTLIAAQHKHESAISQQGPDGQFQAKSVAAKLDSNGAAHTAPTRKVLARSAGVSTGTMGTVERAAREAPDLVEKIKDGEMTAHRAAQIIEIRRKDQAIAAKVEAGTLGVEDARRELGLVKFRKRLDKWFDLGYSLTWPDILAYAVTEGDAQAWLCEGFDLARDQGIV
jgi:hypothetical protein